MDEKGNYEHAPALIVSAPPKSEETKHREHDRQYKNAQTATNVLIAVFTAVTASIGVWQGCMTRSALRDSRENSNVATQQIWRAIDNLNWTARTMKATLGETQESVNLTRTNFTKDQRPYISISDTVRLEMPITAGKKLMWNVYYANYGRSPAAKVVFSIKMFHGAGSKHQADYYFEHLPTVLIGNSYLLPPEQPVPATNGIRGQAFLTPTSSKPLTNEEAEYVNRNDFSTYVVGRVQYEDIEGNRYWTDFCRSTFTNGAINNCEHHNEIH